MRRPLQNLGASVRARLLNLAKERNQPFELLLVRYTLERLLYRLGTSKHRENFVLKGAILMRHWLDDPQRPTRDLDLLVLPEGTFPAYVLGDAHVDDAAIEQALNRLRAIAKSSQCVIVAGVATRRDHHPVARGSARSDHRRDRDSTGGRARVA